MVKSNLLPALAFARRFAGDRRGGVGVAFAASAAVMIAAIGAAVDYNYAVSARTRLQAALDAGVLAGVVEALPGQRVVAAERAFAANIAGAPIGAARAQFVTQADDAFAGTATGVASNSLMRAFSPASDLRVAATAEARRTVVATPGSVTINVGSAKGWFWKRMTLWARERGGAADRLLATYTYQPTSLYNWGTGTNTGPFGQPITLGANYVYAYFKLEVSPDGCPLDMAAAHPEAMTGSDTTWYEPWVCVPLGRGVTKTARPYTFATNDPLTSNHLFVNGRMLPYGSTASILDLAACGQTWTHAWEDTERYDMSNYDLALAWRTQDVEYRVTAGPCVTNTALSSVTPRLRR